MSQLIGFRRVCSALDLGESFLKSLPASCLILQLLAGGSGQEESVRLLQADVLGFPSSRGSDPGLQRCPVGAHRYDHLQDRPQAEEVTAGKTTQAVDFFLESSTSDLFLLLLLCSTNKTTLKKKMLICFSLAVLLGLNWSLGYAVLLTQGDAYLACSIIFCLSTTTQVCSAVHVLSLFT